MKQQCDITHQDNLSCARCFAEIDPGYRYQDARPDIVDIQTNK